MHLLLLRLLPQDKELRDDEICAAGGPRLY